MTRILLPLLLLYLTASAQAAALLPLPDHTTPHVPQRHGPSNRQGWDNGHNVWTNFNHDFPHTGRKVKYDLEITNTTCNPDGHGPRVCMLVNNQYPGPTIRANWGDTVVVNVKNSMQHNGTSMHWHGVRQLMTNDMDGVNGLTECPLAPGTSKTYTFQVTQHGTSWYHAHFSPAYGDGIAGPLIFDGPTTANYDVDLGAYPLTDWYYQTAWQIQSLTLAANQGIGKSPSADNILINGTNKNAQGSGEYNVVKVESGKRYLLRLINMAVDNFIQVTLDGHPFEVVAADFVPVQPLTVDWLMLGAGQRYDVIVTANQSADNYWFRAGNSSACGSTNKFYGRAVWTYDSATFGTPNTTALAPAPSSCAEPAPLVPAWTQRKQLSRQAFDKTYGGLVINSSHFKPDIGGYQPVDGNSSVVLWTLNAEAGQPINVNWSQPTLEYVISGITSYPAELSLIPTLKAGSTNFWVMQQALVKSSSPHPIHLHGHDFAILGSGQGTFNAANATLNFDNPTRRDTAVIQAKSWLAIAFESDNPGAWLMHCHIAWHISAGLGVQFLESPGRIPLSPLHRNQFEGQCKRWTNWWRSSAEIYGKDDSGL